MNETPDEQTGGDDGISGWAVFAGLGSFVLLSPFVFALSLQGGWIGPIAMLIAVGGLTTFLVRSRQRGLGFGIALGYVLTTVFTAGICTGWQSALSDDWTLF